ncbi:hypothetical protein H0H93_000684 [Arthromyces matolae]|nr:hypothetical protein H0H93_000684 [Arthromyces matolae]
MAAAKTEDNTRRLDRNIRRGTFELTFYPSLHVTHALQETLALAPEAVGLQEVEHLAEDGDSDNS